MKKITHNLFLSLALILCASCKKNNSSTTITIDETEPVAHFEWTGSQKVPAEITFTNKTLYGETYHWNFSNGQTSVKHTPDKVTFTTAGSYDIILTAKRGNKSSLIKRTLLITADNKPAAHFSWLFKDQRSMAPATIIVKNESVNADRYEWRIDGVLNTETTPIPILFNQAGDHTITLVALNGTERSAIYEQVITVATNTDPVARFAVNYQPIPYVVGQQVQLVNLSANADTWQWTFGPNGPAATTEMHPLVTFTTAGIYPITLIAKKGNLTSKAFQINLRINAQ